jgi:hypothetical protein
MDPCPRCQKELAADTNRCEACGLDISAVRIAVKQAVRKMREADSSDVDDISFTPPPMLSRLRVLSMTVGAVLSWLSAVVWLIYALWLGVESLDADWPGSLPLYLIPPVLVFAFLLCSLSAYGMYNVFRICIRIAEQEDLQT